MQFLELKRWPQPEGQNQWPPFSIPAERMPRCIFGANLVILAQIHYKLSWRQDKFPRILSQNGQDDLEGHWQWPPLSIPTKSIPGCMFGAYLVILAQIYDELSRGWSEFPIIQSQSGQNYLEGQDQWHPCSIPAESIPGCIFGAYLMILDQICDELSCGKNKVYGRTERWMDRRPDSQTDGQMQAMTIPLWPERPRGKNASENIICFMAAILSSGDYFVSVSGQASTKPSPWVKMTMAIDTI